jgi:hypothetical protein
MSLPSGYVALMSAKIDKMAQSAGASVWIPVKK